MQVMSAKFCVDHLQIDQVLDGYGAHAPKAQFGLRGVDVDQVNVVVLDFGLHAVAGCAHESHAYALSWSVFLLAPLASARLNDLLNFLAQFGQPVNDLVCRQANGNDPLDKVHDISWVFMLFAPFVGVVDNLAILVLFDLVAVHDPL